MKRPRVRIGTLMLLIVIAALVVALFVERRRSAKLVAQMQAAQAEARRREMVALIDAAIAREVAAVRALESVRLAGPDAKTPAKAESPEKPAR